jgi:hypothetical protein
MVRTNQEDAYQFTYKHHILASDDIKSQRKITILVSYYYSLKGVLKDHICWKKVKEITLTVGTWRAFLYRYNHWYSN